MSILGAIEIQMLADLARLKQDMDQAKNLVGNASKEMQRMADLAKTALGAIGVGLSVAGLVNIVKHSIDAAEALHDMSIQTGVSVESLSALQAIGRTTGTSAETIATAMNKLAKNMAVSNEESKGTSQALKALGIDFDTFKRMRPDDQMLMLANAMAKFQDGGGKSAAAMTLMGKEGAKLLPFMTDLAAAGKLVATTTTEQADMADKLNDALEASAMRTQAFSRELSLGMVPTFIEANDLLQVFGSKIGEYLTGSADKATARFNMMKDAIFALGTTMEALIVLGANAAFVFKRMAADIGASVKAFVEMQKWNFTAASQILQQVKKDDAEARQELDKFEASIMGVTERTLQAMDATSKSTVTKADDTRELRRMNEVAGIAEKTQLNFSMATDKAAEAAKKAADAETKRAEEVRKLTSSLDGKIAAQVLELEQGTKLTAAQKEALDILGKLRDGTLKLTEAETLNLAKKLEALLAGEQELAQKAEAAKATQAMTEWQTKWATEQDKTTESLRAQVVSQIAANDELRLGRDAIEQREIAQLRATATDLDWQAANEGGNAVLEEQARLMRQRADLAQEGVALKEAKAVKEEWQRTVDSIGQGLTDSLFRAFESGKDFFSTFWGGVKNLFKTTVLKMMIQPVQNAITGAVGSLFGGMAQAGGAAVAGSSGMGSMLGNIGGLASIGSALGTVGTAASYGASALFGGTGLTALSGGASMVGAGSMAGGLGMMAGVLGPIVLGLFAISALMKNKSAKLGYAGGTFGANGSFNASSGRLLSFGRGDDYASSLQQDYAGVLAETLSNTAASFGGSVGSGLGLFVGSDNDRKGNSAGTIQFLRNGASVGGLQTGGTNPLNSVASKIGVGDLNAWFENATSAALIAGLQQSDLPAKFAEYFGSINAFALSKADAEAMLATASGVLQLTEALAPLGGVFSQLSGLGVQATQDMVNLAGGLEAFNTKAQDYAKAYYSQDEQLSIAASQIRAQLSDAGINADTLGTKEQYRALVDSLDLSAAAGREQLAALLNNASAFASISEALGGRTLADLAALAPSAGLFGSGADAATQTAQASQASAQLLQLSNEHLSSIATSGQDSVTELRALVRVQSEANIKLLDRLDLLAGVIDESGRPSMLADLQSS